MASSPAQPSAEKVMSCLLADLHGSRRAVLNLRGEIGRAEVERLAERSLALASLGRPCQVLDLRRVTHWDYRQLPAIWRLAQRLRARGGDLRLAGPTRYLSTILRFAGLEGLLSVHADPSAASQSFAASAVRSRWGA
jgi:anti-anti-sigma factor